MHENLESGAGAHWLCMHAFLGGLGDVMGALPKALARRGHRVMVVVPRYSNYEEGWETGVRTRFRVSGSDTEVGVPPACRDWLRHRGRVPSACRVWLRHRGGVCLPCHVRLRQ